MAASLTPSRAARADAIAFLIDAYEGVSVRPGKGLPHAQAVADVLRRAGYDDAHAGSSASCTTSSRTRRGRSTTSASAFGEPIATMVGALTEDPSIRHYAQRKRDLRARCVAAGSPVVDVAVADKIATLRHALATEPGSATASCATTRVTLQLALTAGLAVALAAGGSQRG